RISKLRGLNLVCLPSAFRNYWLAATLTVLYLELLRTTSSEPCPPSHTITSPTEPQSYLKVSQVLACSVHLSVQLRCCLTPPGGSTSTSYLSSGSSSIPFPSLTVK
ncbi:hypothetical protein ATANTOWER_004374, partial [Ataeniobius toweri]|nr:hypothetical protein [Ataeniobius toweri]